VGIGQNCQALKGGESLAQVRQEHQGEIGLVAVSLAKLVDEPDSPIEAERRVLHLSRDVRVDSHIVADRYAFDVDVLRLGGFEAPDRHPKLALRAVQVHQMSARPRTHFLTFERGRQKTRPCNIGFEHTSALGRRKIQQPLPAGDCR
jgi:hypothetical protein